MTLSGRWPHCPNCHRDRIVFALVSQEIRCMHCGYSCGIADKNETARRLRDYCARRADVREGQCLGQYAKATAHV